MAISQLIFDNSIPCRTRSPLKWIRSNPHTGDGGFGRPAAEKIPRCWMQLDTGAVRLRRISFQRTSRPPSSSRGASLIAVTVCRPPGRRGPRRQIISHFQCIQSNVH